MEHHEQVRLLNELLAQVRDGTTADAGGHFHNPVSVYTDPEIAAAEAERVFGGYPQILGLSGELPGPGTFVTTDDFGPPVLATRDADGEFRAFLNVCRHRGSVVEPEPRGERSRFVCPFHAWAYDNQGSLVAVPRPKHFGGFDKECHGLVPLPAAERGGFLWVHPNPDGDLDMDAVLGGIESDLDTWGWGSYVRVADDTYEMDLNWKLAMDTFGETYHFDNLHRNTLSKAYYGSIHTSEGFGFNHRLMVCNRNIESMAEKPVEEWSITTGAFPVYSLFPNTALTITSHGVNMLRSYPVPGDPGRSISRVTYYTDPKVLGIREDALKERIAIYTAAVRDEDFTIASTAQRGLGSAAQTHIVFGRNEPALHHWHQSWRQQMGLAPIELTDAPI